MNKPSPITGWVPIKLYLEKDNMLCRWLYVGDKNFNEPFFDETISACRSLPENGHLKRSMSTTEMLIDWEKELEVIEPTAFIFHISRCGSTLISQMLGMQPSTIILSEVPFFDDLLRHGKKYGYTTDLLLQVKAAIRIYGAKRCNLYQQLFIKTDSWHIHFYKQLRELFPHVPFFLLYRKPEEVLQSQQKKRGMQAIPNLLEADIFGFDSNTISTMPLDEYMGLVIESYLTAFANILQQDNNAYPINYHEGGMQLINRIAAITGLNISDEEKILMKQRSGFHAKFPGQHFSEERVQQRLPDYLNKSVDLYNEIENFRLKK